MDDRLDDRVDAVEKAISDGHAADGLPETARMERRLDDLEATVENLDDRLADLEAAVQALRGFAGGVRAVDEEIERRANAAVARVERLEADLQEAPGHGDDRVRRDEAETHHAPETAVGDGAEWEGDRGWRDGNDGGDPDATTEHEFDDVGSGTDGDRGRSDAPAATVGDAAGRIDGSGPAGPAAQSTGASERSDATLAEAAAAAASDVDRPEAEVDESESGEATASLADRVRRLL